MNYISNKVGVYKNYLIVGCIGVVLIASLGIVSYLFKKRALDKYNQEWHTPIVAPYYEDKVFRKPSWLDMPPDASISAIATLEARIKIPIIMYHYVEYVKDINDFIRQRLNINPYIFEKQLKILKDNDYSTYFVKEIPDIFTKKINLASKSIVLTFDDGYEDFYDYVFPLLKKYNHKATLYIVNRFIGRKGFLNETQIKEIIESNLVEVGAHTLDHVYLKYLPKVTVEEQIIDSKKQLEEMFGVEVKTFAYPYGAFSPNTLEIVKKTPFSSAVSVIHGSHYSPSDTFFLPRIRAGMVASDDMIQILEKMRK